MHAHPASRVSLHGILRSLILLTVLVALLPAAQAATSRGLLFPDPFLSLGDFKADKIAAADFNGDGAIDLATCSFYTGGIFILLSVGGGDFEPGQRIDTPGSLISIAAADLNGDGKIDLAVGEYAGSIAIYLGTGDGSFVFDGRYLLGDSIFYSPEYIAIADLNLDGAPDLAVASAKADLSVFLGRGDGTFPPSIHFATGEGNYAIAVADFNLDGFPDLALSSGEEREAKLLLGHGDGDFDPALPIGGATRGFFICSAD